MYFPRLGSIEIQCRSTQDGGHFLCLYRCRRAFFCLILLMVLVSACVEDTRHCICLGLADTYFLCQEQPWYFHILRHSFKNRPNPTVCGGRLPQLVAGAEARELTTNSRRRNEGRHGRTRKGGRPNRLWRSIRR